MGQMNSQVSAEVRAREPIRDRGLGRLVETDIIPRLMLLHAAPPLCPELGDEEVSSFLASLRSPNPSAAQAHVARLLGSGILVENLVAQLIGPTLARLDELRSAEDWTISEIFTALDRLRQMTIKVESDYLR